MVGLDVEVFNFVVEGLGGLGLVEVDLYPVVDFSYVGYTALSEDVSVGVVDLEEEVERENVEDFTVDPINQILDIKDDRR